MRKIYKLLLMLVLGIFIFTGSSFGQNEHYLYFDGGIDNVSYTSDASLQLLDGATDYTIEAWIYPKDADVAEGDRVLQRKSSFSIQMYDQNNDGDVEDWYFVVYDGSNNFFNTEGDATLTLDAWNHIAVINNSSDGTLKLFVNGIDVTQSGGYSNFTLRPSVANDDLCIGARDNSSTYYGFGGYIDEVRLKNTAVAIGDLKTSIYDNQYSTDNNTAALFHFNEGTGGNTLNEASSSNGSLNNVISWKSWSDETSHHLPLAHEWTGASDTDWATAANWGGGVPSSTNDIIIPNVTNDPLIATTTSADCNNLTIESSAVLSIGGDLDVNGTLTNDAGTTGLVLKSTATEQGSLIHNTESVAATVERFITNYTAADDGWHLLSSPVNNMAIAASDFEPVSGTDDLFYWDESQGTIGKWINYHAEGGGFGFTNFTNGQGYLCAYDALDETKEFQGNLNVNNVTRGGFSIVNPDPWELVGNPFSSAIDWSAGTWIKTGLGANAKVFDEGSGNYLTQTIIPSTQGFIVEVTNGTNSLTIPADARLHNGQDWYKGAKEVENTLELKLSGGDNSFYDITQIIFSEGATLEFDDQFDGHKFYGVPSAPQMYTTSPSMEKLTDNHIPDSPNEILVPLNIEVANEGEFSINVELNTIESENDIYLEDLTTGAFVNLSTQVEYTFNANEEDAAERFMLHFNSTTGINDLENKNKVNIYANNNSIYLNAEESINGEIMVFDMGGKLILSEQIKNTNMHRISAEALNGVYLVRFIEAGHISTQKVIIQ